VSGNLTARSVPKTYDDSTGAKEISVRQFLNNLVRNLRSTNAARSGRRPPRRAALQVEGLEDRMVLSTATLNGSTLLVNADPGTLSIIHGNGTIGILQHIRQITFEIDKVGNQRFNVLDNGTSLGQFPFASVKEVDVQVAGLNAVNINDSAGLPFAAGTTISLSGSGLSNSLTLRGSRSITGDETYSPGYQEFTGGPNVPAQLKLGGSTYEFSTTIGSVTDLVHITGSLIVNDGNLGNPSLSGQNGVTQTLSGLYNGDGAGDSLTFGNKQTVMLEMFSGPTVALDATAGAAGERNFEVDFSDPPFNVAPNLTAGANEVDIQATPSTVVTTVNAGGAGQVVNLLANSGPVGISGNSSSTVNLGEPASDGLPTTAGINAGVTVLGVGKLQVSDNGNNTTQENVSVTESTISGPGLFGNSAVVLEYINTASVVINTGQLADAYTVAASVGGSFHSLITIDDGSTTALNVQVTVGSNSDLELIVVGNSEVLNASVSITAEDGGTFSSPKPHFLEGTEFVAFAGVQSSQVAYIHCGVVLHSA
jgi:hypothetical protein